MFQDQFRLTAAKNKLVTAISLFVSLIYGKVLERRQQYHSWLRIQQTGITIRYIEMQQRVRQMKEVNDCAEREIALIPSKQLQIKG